MKNLEDLERKLVTIYGKVLKYEDLIIETPGGFNDRSKVKAVEHQMEKSIYWKHSEEQECCDKNLKCCKEIHYYVPSSSPYFSKEKARFEKHYKQRFQHKIQQFKDQKSKDSKASP